MTTQSTFESGSLTFHDLYFQQPGGKRPVIQWAL
jgi:hypothetical protein